MFMNAWEQYTIILITALLTCVGKQIPTTFSVAILYQTFFCQSKYKVFF